MEEWKRDALNNYVGSWLGDRENTVLEHGYASTNRALPWWKLQLESNGMGSIELTPDPVDRGSEFVIRRDLLLLGTSPGILAKDDELLRLLWHVVWWGSGAKHSRVSPKISAFADPHNREHHFALLKEAVGLARDGQLSDAHKVLHSHGRATVPQLGPSYFTKFLYFVTGGEPALILDKRAVRSLRELRCPLLGKVRIWSAEGYQEYCQTLATWAVEISEDGTACQPDELERALFEGRPRSSNV